jgi:hypothetical protein
MVTLRIYSKNINFFAITQNTYDSREFNLVLEVIQFPNNAH